MVNRLLFTGPLRVWFLLVGFLVVAILQGTLLLALFLLFPSFDRLALDDGNELVEVKESVRVDGVRDGEERAEGVLGLRCVPYELGAKLVLKNAEVKVGLALMEARHGERNVALQQQINRRLPLLSKIGQSEEMKLIRNVRMRWGGRCEHTQR